MMRFPALLCSLALSAPAWAHHSVQSQFDIHKTISVSGTVAKIEFINPHSYLTVNVKGADGKVQKWAFEMGAANTLRRAGLSRVDRGGIKSGDEGDGTALPARDGSKRGLLQQLKLSGGRGFKFSAAAAGNVDAQGSEG